MLDKSVSRNDPWSQGDDTGFELKPVDIGEQRLAMGRTMQEPMPDDGFAQNEALEIVTYNQPVQPMLEPEQQPRRTTHEGIRRLLAGKKLAVAAAPDPPTTPRRSKIAAINNMPPRKPVAAASPPPVPLTPTQPQPPAAQPPERIVDPARETADQKAFQESLNRLISFSQRKPRTKTEVMAFKVFRRNAYSELVGLARTAAPGFRELIRAWFEKFALPLKDGGEIGSKTLDRATEAAKQVLSGENRQIQTNR